MENLSRRSFLQKSSVAVGTAGAMAAAPAIGKVALRRGMAAPKAGGTSAEVDHELPEDVKADGSIIAHVRDVKSGEIDLFVGAKKITVKDRATAARLYRATH
jgi:hypothetical protein